MARGNIAYDQIRAAHRQGTGSAFQMFGGGTPVAGNAAVYDADGNVIDGGVAPGGGGGGGGGGNYYGSHANLPASPTAGDVYYCTDAPLIYVAGGSPVVWSAWACGYNVTEPDLNSFAWVNQGTATTDITKGGIFLLAPAAANNNMRILKKAAPSTPYTITIAFISCGGPDNYSECGLCFRQSSDGKLCIWLARYDNAWKILGYKMNDPTTPNSHYGWYNLPVGGNAPLIWLRIADDGANRICSQSSDGQHWVVFHTVGRTDFLTADEVGFLADASNATWPTGIWLFHWAEA